MAEAYVVEPDLGFINDVAKLGGGDLKKCYQCATCSVACPISPDNHPFPRKEMIATSWGLKDKLVGNSDIWLCHNCGDCTTLCPRGAKPGDVLSALRLYTIQEYATPKKLAKMVNDPKKLPVLLAVPAVIFIVLGVLLRIFGVPWFHPFGGEEQVWQSDFINNFLVDIIMIPTFTFSVLVFALGLKRFVGDMHKNALAAGYTDKKSIDPKGFIEALIRVVPTILAHRKFSECSENRERATSHMMVLYGFIGLFVVTSCFFVADWVFHIDGPYRQINPIKWLANFAGLSLVIGSALLIKNRFSKKDQVSNYWDWYLVGLAFGLGITGLLTEMCRLAGMMTLSNLLYFLHLILIWSLFAYTPFSKLAHLVYRTTAMVYNEYIGRK
jgi:quinone-modifying oxidoreductase, subunit QmoC